jgi:hypothetical protein
MVNFTKVSGHKRTVREKTEDVSVSPQSLNTVKFSKDWKGCQDRNHIITGAPHPFHIPCLLKMALAWFLSLSSSFLLFKESLLVSLGSW